MVASLSNLANLNLPTASLEPLVNRAFQGTVKKVQKANRPFSANVSVGVRRATRLSPCDFKGFQRHLQSAYVLVRLIHLP